MPYAIMIFKDLRLRMLNKLFVVRDSVFHFCCAYDSLEFFFFFKAIMLLELTDIFLLILGQALS